MDEPYHYPADLLNLLVEAIPRLHRSKRDVITFFRSCGVPKAVLADLEAELLTNPEAVRKAHQVRTVLTRLNEDGDCYLRQRREVIKRVTDTEDFSTCWGEDRLAAAGLVAQVRATVHRHDAFVRLERERELVAAEARRRREDAIATQLARSQAIKEVHDGLKALLHQVDPQKRGLALESLLNHYFSVEGIAVREAFTFREASEVTTLEQIDGVIELDAHPYLVEVKWWAQPLGPGDVAQHMVRVAHRSEVRGLVVSAAGFTPAAVKMCRDELQHRVFVLCELRELVVWLESEDRLAARLRDKIRRAQIDKEPLHLTV
jgi:hypothetical protein